MKTLTLNDVKNEFVEQIGLLDRRNSLVDKFFKKLYDVINDTFNYCPFNELVKLYLIEKEFNNHKVFAKELMGNYYTGMFLFLMKIVENKLEETESVPLERDSIGRTIYELKPKYTLNYVK